MGFSNFFFLLNSYNYCKNSLPVSFLVGSPCEAITQELYTKIDIVKPGRDPNVTYSHGIVIKVSCHQGYGLNIWENGTARCARGKWKPDKPHCRICE